MTAFSVWHGKLPNATSARTRTLSTSRKGIAAVVYPSPELSTKSKLDSCQPIGNDDCPTADRHARFPCRLSHIPITMSLKVRRTLGNLLLLFALTFPAFGSAQNETQRRLTPEEVEAWRQDLHSLLEAISRVHPNPFYRTSAAELDSVTRSLAADLPRLTRAEAIVGLMRIVATLHDGHSAIHPAFAQNLGFHYLALELYQFSDGVFVRRADSANAALAGAQVLSIGRLNIDSAMRLAGGVISHENDYWVRRWAPFYLTIPEITEALGITERLTETEMTVRRDGVQKSVRVRIAGELRPPAGHSIGSEVDRRTWVDMQPPGVSAALWTTHAGDPYWVEYLAANHMVYVSYRGIVSKPDGESNPAFFERVFKMVDTLAVDSFVLDLRENGGGNNFFNRGVVRGIVQRPKIDRPGHLFVVTSRATFSAAQNLVIELERYTNAALVGEPTGNATNFGGDNVPVTLPKTGLTVSISSLWWSAPNPRDRRESVSPQVAVDMSSSDYRRGLDPTLAAINRRVSEPSLEASLESDMARNDTLAAQELVKSFRDSPENRFVSAEPIVNALGYRLLNQHDTVRATAVFRLNTSLFPESANAHDSLGEAYERGGDKVAAIRSYKRALAIDPGFASSRAGLARLGGRL